jgi:hypothetical protein
MPPGARSSRGVAHRQCSLHCSIGDIVIASAVILCSTWITSTA